MKCIICKKEEAVRDGFCAECFVTHKILLGEDVSIVKIIDGISIVDIINDFRRKGER